MTYFFITETADSFLELFPILNNKTRGKHPVFFGFFLIKNYVMNIITIKMSFVLGSGERKLNQFD